MSECTSYDIMEMGYVVYLNALYIVLWNQRRYISNAFYMILIRWEVVYLWMSFMWFFMWFIGHAALLTAVLHAVLICSYIDFTFVVLCVVIIVPL